MCMSRALWLDFVKDISTRAVGCAAARAAEMTQKMLRAAVSPHIRMDAVIVFFWGGALILYSALTVGSALASQSRGLPYTSML